MKKLIKQILGPRLQYIRTARSLSQAWIKGFGIYDRECPLCDYKGRFLAEVHFPDVFNFDALCPVCASLSRNRLLWLAITRHALITASDHVLHFAPEHSVRDRVRAISGTYQTADLIETHVDLNLNIEKIALPDASVDAIICSHVLEHVDDHLALAELYRILRPGGRLLALVPIVEGWTETFERTPPFDQPGRRMHYGRGDHLRRFGRDFEDRMRAPGFALQTIALSGEDCVRFGTLLGEKVFVGRKPA